MGEYLNSLSSLEPLYEAQPNSRFASTFLSNDYRKYAIKGEALQDKDTGEIFIKDKYGRVLNNTQAKRTIEDEMFDVAMMLKANPTFTRPSQTVDGKESTYISSQIDVMSLFNNNKFDMSTSDWIYKKDGIINRDSDFLGFTISEKSNGFFIDLTTPNVFKQNVALYASDYNIENLKYIKNQNKMLTDLRSAAKKDIDIRWLTYTTNKWALSHAVINYSVFSHDIHDLSGTSEPPGIGTLENSLEFTFTDFIRINENNCIIIPENAITKLKQDYVKRPKLKQAFFVIINYILFPKFNLLKNYFGTSKANLIDFKKYMYTHREYDSTEVSLELMYGSDALPLEYVKIGRFVDSPLTKVTAESGDVSKVFNTAFGANIITTKFIKRALGEIQDMEKNSNTVTREEQLISTFMSDKLDSYMRNLGVSGNGGKILVNKEIPSDDVYITGSMWAEPISTYFHAGKVDPSAPHLDVSNKEFAVLEMLLSGYKDPDNSTIYMDPQAHEFYIGDKKIKIAP